MENDPFVRHVRMLNAPPFLDVHVVDHCNLGCAGCLHYAPVAAEHYLDLASYERDLAALASVPVVQGFFRSVILMGGEPLLHPQLPEIVALTRKYFTELEIIVSSNGLLVKRMSEAFWDACRSNDVSLGLSVYPIHVDYKALADLARSHGVKVVIAGDVTGSKQGKQVFWRNELDPLGRCSPVHSWTICHMDYTLQLRDGKLFPCNRGAYLDALNGAFGTCFEHQEGDFIRISDVRSADDLDAFRRTVHPMCRYCDNDKTRVVAWERSKREASEWLSVDGAEG